MNSTSLAGMILIDAVRISVAEAVSTGAAWEIWMQVEMAILLRQRQIQVAREVPYPDPNSNLSLDILAADAEGQYAIELKVESGNNAGAKVLASAQEDMQKIRKYQFDRAAPPGIRWVVAIAYSSTARLALSSYAAANAGTAHYGENQDIGVLVVTC